MCVREVNGRRSRAKEEVLWSALMEDFLLLSLKKCHVTRPDKEWDPELRGRLERAEAEGGGLDSIDWPVNQSHFVFSSMMFLTALQQIR